MCHSACHARAWQDQSDQWAGATGHRGSGYEFRHTCRNQGSASAPARLLSGFNQIAGLSGRDRLQSLHPEWSGWTPTALLSPGPLTREERDTVRTHTQSGYETLFRRKDLNFSQLMMVYQHHERWDGRGYPVQLVGREIHPMARLTAVADVFDALTAARPYRKALRAAVVLEFLRDHAGRHFDKEMVSCWTAAFSI